MKICITSTQDNINADIDMRFGRCRYFLIIDTDTMNVDAISNESIMESGGAGVKAAQTVAKTGVKTVITGNIGPNAFQTLKAAGINIITGADGTIKEIIDKLKNNEYETIKSPSVGNHFGIKRG